MLITLIDFLYSPLRMLPVWGSKETKVKTMPYCLKSKCPIARIILDCTQLFMEMSTSYISQSAILASYKHHKIDNFGTPLRSSRLNFLLSRALIIVWYHFEDGHFTSTTWTVSLSPSVWDVAPSHGHSGLISKSLFSNLVLFNFNFTAYFFNEFFCSEYPNHKQHF